MSVAAIHATAFYREVAAKLEVWGIQDAEGCPAPTNADGRRAMPFWSSEQRALKVISAVAALKDFKPMRIGWDEFVAKWIPGLTEDGLLAGVNWTSNNAQGYDIEPHELMAKVEAIAGLSRH